MNNDFPKPSNRVAVIGGGLTGLTIAHALRKQGRPVVIFERTDRLGGHVRSTRENGFLIEHGPHTLLLPRPASWPLLQALGLDEKVLEPSPQARRRYVVRAGRALPLPSGALDFLKTPLFSAKAKLRVMAEVFSARAKAPDESLADFVQRHLGPEFLDYALDPFVRGVYAGNPRELCLRWAFPRMHALEKNHRSLVLGALARKFAAMGKKDVWKTKTFSFADGMETLPRALAEGLPPDDVRTGATLTSVAFTPREQWEIIYARRGGFAEREVFDTLVLTVPAHDMGDLPLPEKLRGILSPLRGVAHAAVAVLHQGFRREDVEHPLDGFGVLVPSKEPFEVLGTLFASSTFAGRAPEGHVLLSTYIGGRQRPDLAYADEETQARIVARDMGRLLGLKAAPVFQKRLFYPNAIAQYRAGHGEIVRTCEHAEAEFPGLFLAGNYREGIAASAALTRGLDTAGRILNDFTR